MEFDYIVGNPPYKGNAALHQQIFNRTVDLLKPGGQIEFVQPATPYQNNKENKKAHEVDMIANLEKYQTTAKIVSGEQIFTDANISTDLAITTLTKTVDSFKGINKITYMNGNTYYNVCIDDISMTQIPPDDYRPISDKYKKLLAKTGSIYPMASLKIKDATNAVALAQIRGNRSADTTNRLKSDYFTFMSPNDIKRTKDITHGLVCDKKHNKNIQYYLSTKFARFALALSKFNTNVHRGELKTVPLIDFDTKFTDDELFNMYGFTKSEVDIINGFIPDYPYKGINA